MRRRASSRECRRSAATRFAQAQPRSDIPRIGLLFAAAPPAVAARVDAFRAGLAALGYTEGAQVAFEIRYANGDLTPPAEAGRGTRAAARRRDRHGRFVGHRPAAGATRTIPIVMGQDNDPVGSGFAASLARPGGNVTGLSTLVPELAAKQVALLAEIVPGVSRIAVIGDASEAGNAQSVAEAERAAKRLKIDVQYLDVRKAGDPAQLFALATRGRVGAVLVLASGYLFARQREVTDLALRARLPALYAHPEFVRSGGLATYGVNVIELFGRAAGYVVKILGGAKPADLPIEQPTKFEFVISLKVAKEIGITIPQSLLLRADEVIQ